MKRIDQLSVKIFADGADLAGMLELYRQPFIKDLRPEIPHTVRLCCAR